MKHISTENRKISVVSCRDLSLQLANNRNNNRGATLIELLVYTVLFGMVFTGIYLVFSASVKYYYVAQSNVWVQHSSMNMINELSRDLAESDLSSVKLYGPTETYPGIVFMTPRKTNGTIEYNSGSYEGQPKWQKYICYYLGADPNDSSKKVIFRKETTTDLNADSASQSSYTTSNFAGDASLPKKIVAYNVKPYDAGDSEHSGFVVYWLSSGSKTYGVPTSNPIYISITSEETYGGKVNNITTKSSMEALN